MCAPVTLYHQRFRHNADTNHRYETAALTMLVISPVTPKIRSILKMQMISQLLRELIHLFKIGDIILLRT